MFFGKEMQDMMQQFFDELSKTFSPGNTPFSELQHTLLRQFLEFQMGMLKAYQTMVEQHLSQDAMREVMSQMMKSFMLASMNLYQSGRDTRATSLKGHAEFVRNYVKLLENMLERLKEQEKTSQSASSSPL